MIEMPGGWCNRWRVGQRGARDARRRARDRVLARAGTSFRYVAARSALMSRTGLERAGAVAILAMAAACGDGPTGPRLRGEPVDLSAEWEVGSPASMGVDPGVMADATAHARTLPRLLSLLVVRHGVLVVEEYFNGNRADSLNDARSVTKSVVSTLTGIAARRGEVTLSTPIGPHLTPWAGQLDEAERAISVAQLLTMTGGWQWDESTTTGYNDWVLSGEPIEYLLRKPLAANPGTRFTYNSAAVHLLATVLEDATGTSVQEYAEEHLFRPLGIRRARWEIFPDGSANGGAGLDLRARDLAKLGQLWLQNGDAGGERVLDASWTANGSSPAFVYWSVPPPLRDQSYGFLWWLTRSPSLPAFFAWGYGGQFVWVTPALNLVVVVTHEWRNAGSYANDQARNGLDLIANHVIPAVR